MPENLETEGSGSSVQMQKKRSKSVATFFDSVINLCASLSGFLLVFTTLSVCLEVVMRYFINRPLTWVDEITEYILLYITFLGTAWVLKRDEHVVFDVLLTRVGEKSRAVLGFISSILCIPVCLVLIWYGSQVAWDHYQRGVYNPTLLEFPKGLVIAIIPLGSLLLLVQFLRRIYGSLNTWKILRKGG